MLAHNELVTRVRERLHGPTADTYIRYALRTPPRSPARRTEQTYRRTWSTGPGLPPATWSRCVGLGSRVAGPADSPATSRRGTGAQDDRVISSDSVGSGAGCPGDVLERSARRDAFILVRDVPSGPPPVGSDDHRAWVSSATSPRAAVPRSAMSQRACSWRTGAGASAHPGPPPPRRALHPDQAGLGLYTSGSTGRPHGADPDFRNIDANSRSIVEYLGLGRAGPGDVDTPALGPSRGEGPQTDLRQGGGLSRASHRLPADDLETTAAKDARVAAVLLTFDMTSGRSMSPPRPVRPPLSDAGGWSDGT